MLTLTSRTEYGLWYHLFPRNVCPGFKWYCCSLVIVR